MAVTPWGGRERGSPDTRLSAAGVASSPTSPPCPNALQGKRLGYYYSAPAAVKFANEASSASRVNLNDGISNSFGRLDPQSSASGVPSVIFPATVNDHGEPANLQLMGRAWDDAKLVGFAYDFDLQAKAHIAPATAPKLAYAPSVTPKPIVIEKPATPVTTAPAPDPSTNVAPPPPAAKPPGTAPPPAPVGTARLSVLNPNAAADSKGRFTVLLSCSGKGTCRAKLTLRRSSKVIGRKTVSVKTGTRSRVLVATTGSTRRSLARGSRIKVRVVLAPLAGTAVSKPMWTVAVRAAK